MARLNVEDDWFTDETGRRALLIHTIQQQPVRWDDAADGMALRAWRLAQRFWKDGEKLIPESDWKRARLEPMIEADLAERRPDGIYVRGTKEKHAWLRKKALAGAKGGKKSVQTRAAKLGSADPHDLVEGDAIGASSSGGRTFKHNSSTREAVLPKSEALLHDREAETNPLPLPLALALPLSSSNL